MSVATSSISISATRKRGRAARSRRPLPRLASDREVVIGRANVPDPWDPGAYREVQVNRRVDVLAQELAAKRIDRAEFEVGRMIQAVFERGSGARLGSGGWAQGGSRDQTIAHELAIIYALDDAERVRKFTAHLQGAIGGVGVRFLHAILAEGHTFAAYAARTGKGSGDRAATDVAKRFRWLLEALTEAQHTATGATGQVIRATRVIERPVD